MDYSPPGSSVHGILQARILEWVAISFMGSSRSRDRTQVSCVAGRFFTIWATREAPRWHSKSESRSVQLFPLHFSFYVNYKYKFVLCLVTKLCSTLCHPMDCSPPGPSVLGDSPGGLPYPPPGDLPNQGSNPGLHIGSRFFTIWATRQALNINLDKYKTANLALRGQGGTEMSMEWNTDLPVRKIMGST